MKRNLSNFNEQSFLYDIFKSDFHVFSAIPDVELALDLFTKFSFYC